MAEGPQSAIDAILMRIVKGEPRVPGVVAILTDREPDVYIGATGVRSLAGDTPMSPHTVCAIFSTTKAIAGTVCLQLVERGEIDLDAPARDYVPEIGELQVIDGFADDGTPRLRPPVREITTRMLLTHTAGFGYDRVNGIGGFWATQIFPFADPTSVGGYLEFESAAYAGIEALAPA